MEAVTTSDKRGDAHTLVETLANTLAEVEAVTLLDTWGDAQALVDTLADTLEAVEAVTLGDARSDAHALVDTLASTLAKGGGGDTRQYTERCARTGRHSGLHASRGAVSH